jgi:hypothetical protein
MDVKGLGRQGSWGSNYREQVWEDYMFWKKKHLGGCWMSWGSNMLGVGHSGSQKYITELSPTPSKMR